jgi:hypothetical protein
MYESKRDFYSDLGDDDRRSGATSARAASN